LPDSLRDRATAGVNIPLIEVSPPSPTGSDDSIKTIRVIGRVKEASILTTPNTPNTEFFNKQQNNNPPSSLPLLEAVSVLPVKGATYPDPNLGI